MAYSKQQWEKAKEYFEAGLSLTQIEDRTGISRPQISKKSNKEKWEKGNEKQQLIVQAVNVATKKETLKETALEVHNEIVEESVRRKKLVFGAGEKIIQKATHMIDVVSSASDLKALSDTVDKTSITLGVNQRHANQNINMNTQNNVGELSEISKNKVIEVLEDFESEY